MQINKFIRCKKVLSFFLLLSSLDVLIRMKQMYSKQNHSNKTIKKVFTKKIVLLIKQLITTLFGMVYSTNNILNEQKKNIIKNI